MPIFGNNAGQKATTESFAARTTITATPFDYRLPGNWRINDQTQQSK